jgi:threonine dehydrogenase-like Zn-dependent dehydrogenase
VVNSIFQFARVTVISIGMRAIRYGIKPAGWATCWLLKRLWRGCLLSRLNGLSLVDVEPPPLPGTDWVRVRTSMAGICGTDLALLAHKQPPDSILQAFSSLPAIFGHENLGVVEQVGPDVDEAWLGRRVTVEPTLCCRVRGIDPPCDRCREGQFGACQNFADDGRGRAGLPPGTSLGYNAGAGGTFAEQFVAHVSQLVGVPDELPDELAVLTDPVACSLHAALRVDLAGAERILVYGAGVLGLAAIAALRAIGYQGRIDAIDLHEYLQPLARSMGADELLRLPGGDAERFERIAQQTGASVQRARFGNYMLSGGYDVVFDCVGSNRAITESLKWTRSRGQVVLLATGHGRGVDMTPIWFTELTVIGAYGRQIETWQGRQIGTYELVHELMAAGKLDVRALLTHTFALDEYKRAFAVGMDKPRHQAVKVALDFR